MASRRNALHERFFTALTSGDRATAHAAIDHTLDQGLDAPEILSNLVWTTLQHIQSLHREDQVTPLAYQYATRLLRQIVDQMQLRLERKDPRGITVLVVSGEEQSEEIAAQMTTDFLEADGYRCFFPGGGIANDEIVNQLGELKADKLVIFGAVAATVPQTRLLIDHLQSINACPNLQVVVGGGVFNRAEGLAEEIGADLWANDPAEVVEVMNESPNRRMTPDQRTVGRKRRPAPAVKAAQSEAA
ncbi:MAG: hypothetical protein AAF750_04430 [Planctomycetota bacterium]